MGHATTQKLWPKANAQLGARPNGPRDDAKALAEGQHAAGSATHWATQLAAASSFASTFSGTGLLSTYPGSSPAGAPRPRSRSLAARSLCSCALFLW